MRTTVVLVVSIFVMAVPAHADGWEIVPFVGYRVGGEVDEIDTNRTLSFEPSGVFGLTVGRYLKPETRLEGTWSHQSTSLDRTDFDITLDYLHFAGVYEPNPERDTTAYVLVSGGLTLFDASGAGITSNLSFSIGGGGRFDLGRRTSFKLEGRMWGTFTSAGLGVFCAGGCIFAFSGTGVFQFEVTTGLAIGF